MKKYLRPAIAIAGVAVTVVLFVHYLLQHPETTRQIRHMPPLVLGELVVLYGVFFAALALVTRASLHMFGKHMSGQQNFLFNAYSSLVNFFGPGQSGPIFRGAFLKKKYGLSVASYALTLLVYYAFYAVISVMMAFAGTRPWWQTVLAMAAAAAGCAGAIRWYKHKNQRKITEKAVFNRSTVGLLFGATALQMVMQVCIYAIELHSFTHVSIGQVLAYTGVANFALFVALTPGAIGIREGFLRVSEHLHHIGSSTIVAANIVDRAAYLVFLGLLFVIVLSLHARKKLNVSQLDLSDKKQ